MRQQGAFCVFPSILGVRLYSYQDLPVRLQPFVGMMGCFTYATNLAVRSIEWMKSTIRRQLHICHCRTMLSLTSAEIYWSIRWTDRSGRSTRKPTKPHGL